MPSLTYAKEIRRIHDSMLIVQTMVKGGRLVADGKRRKEIRHDIIEMTRALKQMNERKWVKAVKQFMVLSHSANSEKMSFVFKFKYCADI